MEGNTNTVEEVNKVTQGNTEFGGRLYDMMSGEPGNIIMSPFSVSPVIAMASASASAVCRTAPATPGLLIIADCLGWPIGSFEEDMLTLFWPDVIRHPC